MLLAKNIDTKGIWSQTLFYTPPNSQEVLPVAQRLSGIGVNSISPDGTRVLLTASDIPIRWTQGEFTEPGMISVFSMDLSSGLITNLGDSDYASSFPDWSPDSQQIVYENARGDVGNIMRVNADGSNVVQLTRDGISFLPRWSSDGKFIAFVRRYSDFKSHLYLMDANGDNVKQLTNENAVDGYSGDLCWSPDGQYLAFSRAEYDPVWSHEKPRALYLIHIQTGELIKIDDGPAKLPVWLTDGRQLAYIHGTDTTMVYGNHTQPSHNELITYDVTQKSKKTLVSYDAQLITHLQWSPDGQLIQFSLTQRENGFKSTVKIVDINTGKIVAQLSGYDYLYWIHKPIPFESTPVECLAGVSGLSPGGKAILSPGRTSNPLRVMPGRKPLQIAEIQQGTILTLIQRACAPERIYWLVQLPDGTEGWTAEGDGKVSWLIPYTGQTPTQISSPVPAEGMECFKWARLQVGITAIVMPGTPNRVRSEPKIGDNIIASIPSGTIVTVIEGPVCADGLVFWKVENSTIPGGSGWTAEGDGKEYWLEPMK